MHACVTACALLLQPWFVSGTRDRYYHSLMKCRERFRPGDCVMLKLKGTGPNRGRGKQAPAEIVYIW
jgi:hypothetical protein